MWTSRRARIPLGGPCDGDRRLEWTVTLVAPNILAVRLMFTRRVCRAAGPHTASRDLHVRSAAGEIRNANRSPGLHTCSSVQR